jgi:hypothetical protein
MAVAYKCLQVER